MINYSLIKDPEVRKAINELEKRINRIESIPQLPRTSSTGSIVDAINKITNSLKRKS